jgi:hypothetical protein
MAYSHDAGYLQIENEYKRPAFHPVPHMMKLVFWQVELPKSPLSEWEV